MYYYNNQYYYPPPQQQYYPMQQNFQQQQYYYPPQQFIQQQQPPQYYDPLNDPNFDIDAIENKKIFNSYREHKFRQKEKAANVKNRVEKYLQYKNQDVISREHDNNYNIDDFQHKKMLYNYHNYMNINYLPEEIQEILKQQHVSEINSTINQSINFQKREHFKETQKEYLEQLKAFNEINAYSTNLRYTKPKDPNNPYDSIIDYDTIRANPQYKYQIANYIDRTTVVFSPDEVWGKIKENPNYLISTYGRLYSEYNETLQRANKQRSGWLYYRMDDYYHTQAEVGNSGRIIARYMLHVFRPLENEDDYEVTYIDGNKYNLHLSNLVWVYKGTENTPAVKEYLRDAFKDKQVVQSSVLYYNNYKDEDDD